MKGVELWSCRAACSDLWQKIEMKKSQIELVSQTWHGSQSGLYHQSNLRMISNGKSHLITRQMQNSGAPLVNSAAAIPPAGMHHNAHNFSLCGLRIE